MLKNGFKSLRKLHDRTILKLLVWWKKQVIPGWGWSRRAK